LHEDRHVRRRGLILIASGRGALRVCTRGSGGGCEPERHGSDARAELASLWALYRPQLDDYVVRALDPTAAPSYGVPGDL